MAAMKIHGSEYILSKVFSNDFAFEIPHYQRPYSWTLEQTGELRDDLSSAMDAGNGAPIEEVPPYFLGAVVLIKPDHASDAKVVDGQQRLTTLKRQRPACAAGRSHRRQRARRVPRRPCPAWWGLASRPGNRRQACIWRTAGVSFSDRVQRGPAEQSRHHAGGIMFESTEEGWCVNNDA